MIPDDTRTITTTSRNGLGKFIADFLFVCFGNIMPGAMAEFLMRQALREAGLEEQVRIRSADLHAKREAHLWAQEASANLAFRWLSTGPNPWLEKWSSDCILAVDFQSKAELLTLYPESQGKIYMLSAYAEGPLQYRGIPDQTSAILRRHDSAAGNCRPAFAT